MDEYFTIAPFGNFTVVEFQTPSLMSGTEIEQIENQLLGLVDQGAECILLDFKIVEYLSSRAIGTIMALHKRVAKTRNGKLVLCSVRPALLSVFKITRLDKMLKICETREQVTG